MPQLSQQLPQQRAGGGHRQRRPEHRELVVVLAAHVIRKYSGLWYGDPSNGHHPARAERSEEAARACTGSPLMRPHGPGAAAKHSSGSEPPPLSSLNSMPLELPSSNPESSSGGQPCQHPAVPSGSSVWHKRLGVDWPCLLLSLGDNVFLLR